MKRSTGWWIAAAGWAGSIFAVSSMKGSSLPGGYSIQAHFIEYFVLAVLLFNALRPRHSAARAALLALLIASAYGITDEIHQAFVPLRTPDPRDWLTDTAGAALGVACAWAVSAWREGRRTAS